MEKRLHFPSWFKLAMFKRISQSTSIIFYYLFLFLSTWKHIKLGYFKVFPDFKTTFDFNNIDMTIFFSFQPLYIRYDPNPIPGLTGMFPLYLSKHYVSNTRWRVLPVQSTNISRFEQEGLPINVTTNEYTHLELFIYLTEVYCFRFRFRKYT